VYADPGPIVSRARAISRVLTHDVYYIVPRSRIRRETQQQAAFAVPAGSFSSLSFAIVAIGESIIPAKRHPGEGKGVRSRVLARGSRILRIVSSFADGRIRKGSSSSRESG